MNTILLKAKKLMPVETEEAYRKKFIKEYRGDRVAVIPNAFEIEVIPDGQTWVDIKIIEPKEFREILFCDKAGIIYAGTRDGLGRYIDRSGERIENVVAWMPAPKAYEVRE